MEAQDISLPGDSDSIVSNFFEKLEEPQAEAYYDVIRALKLQEWMSTSQCALIYFIFLQKLLIHTIQ